MYYKILVMRQGIEKNNDSWFARLREAQGSPHHEFTTVQDGKGLMLGFRA